MATCYSLHIGNEAAVLQSTEIRACFDGGVFGRNSGLRKEVEMAQFEPPKRMERANECPDGVVQEIDA